MQSEDSFAFRISRITLAFLHHLLNKREPLLRRKSIVWRTALHFAFFAS